MLQAIDDRLYVAHDDLYLPGRIHFPLRMTAMVLDKGEVVLHSPIAITDELAVALDQLGTVAHILAPNLMHHLYLAPALERWPKAKLYAAPGLAAKCPNLPIAQTLGDQVPAAWGHEIDQVLLAGMPKVNEVLFFHRPSASLLVTDLVFNLHRPPNWLTALILRMVGAHKRLAQSRVERLLTKDRDAARAALARVMDWPFERVIMAHGDIVDRDAKARMAEAWQWMLKD